MIPELGQLALILALLLAAAQCILPLIGAQTGNRALIATARPIFAGQAVFVTAEARPELTQGQGPERRGRSGLDLGWRASTRAQHGEPLSG